MTDRKPNRIVVVAFEDGKEVPPADYGDMMLERQRALRIYLKGPPITDKIRRRQRREVVKRRRAWVLAMLFTHIMELKMSRVEL